MEVVERDDLYTLGTKVVEEALDADAQRGQFREGCERLLVHLSSLIGETLDQAGRRPDLVYLTGGMAKATIVREYLWQILGDGEVVDSDHFSSVTEGLTLWARRLFGGSSPG